MKENMEIKPFPKDFLWGVATSAGQIEGAAHEGGKGLNIWDVFSRIPGRIAGGDTPETACDFYHRYEEDIAHIKELGVKSYRFSFSWTRILPEGTGKVNEEGIAFYKRMINCLKENDIVPNATMYHWDLPYALQLKGGFGNREMVSWFREYARVLLANFGADIPLWTTFNEPIATYVGYGMGVFAPGLKDEKYARQALHNMLLCHGETVKLFREMAIPNAKIGIVVDVWKHYPRPQFVREDWLCLNGQWEFEIDWSESGETRKFYERPSLKGKILVPYCPESKLSGVKDRNFIPCVWYRKTVTLPNSFQGKQVMLHIGAVDYHAKLWVNGKFVDQHTGGYVPFSADITGALVPGENVLTVCAYDHIRSHCQPSGKQSVSFESQGCYYTRTTGIWQSVLLEPVERDFSHPAIIGWCPFNETWDFEGRKQWVEGIRTVYLATKAADPTRPVIDTSGNFHVETDVFDVHDYEQDPKKFAAYYDRISEGIVKDQCERYPMWAGRQKFDPSLPVFVSEYGGTRWDAEDCFGWGYGEAVKNPKEFLARYQGLTDALLDNPNIMGFCYTQLYDVEQEKNGLMTYERKFKFDPAIFYRINTRKAAIED